MKSQPGKQTITKHILLNNWKSKGNKTTKFGQLIEYNMRNFFLEKLFSNQVEKLFPDTFLKNQNWS